MKNVIFGFFLRPPISVLNFKKFASFFSFWKSNWIIFFQHECQGGALSICVRWNSVETSNFWEIYGSSTEAWMAMIIFNEFCPILGANLPSNMGISLNWSTRTQRNDFRAVAFQRIVDDWLSHHIHRAASGSLEWVKSWLKYSFGSSRSLLSTNASCSSRLWSEVYRKNTLWPKSGVFWQSLSDHDINARFRRTMTSTSFVSA